MRDLYTSLTRTKAALNGGELPPMTPLTDRARALMDPAFTIGMGALTETERGLCCPIRGCGRFYHYLGHHISKAHPDIGVVLVREALSLGPSAVLSSMRAREQMRANPAFKHTRPPASRGQRPKNMGSRPVAVLNARNACEAQLIKRLQAFEQQCGFVPTAKTFLKGSGVGTHTIWRLFGSWNSFRVAAGFPVASGGPGKRPPTCHGLAKWTQSTALAAIRKWADFNNHIPTSGEASQAKLLRQPYYPHYATVRRLFSPLGWRDIILLVADHALLDMATISTGSRDLTP